MTQPNLSYSDGAFRGTVTANDASGSYKLSSLGAGDGNSNYLQCYSFTPSSDETTTSGSCYRSSEGSNAYTTQTFDGSPTFTITRDFNAPTVTGTPATPANDAGWYKAPVDIVWSARGRPLDERFAVGQRHRPLQRARRQDQTDRCGELGQGLDRAGWPGRPGLSERGLSDVDHRPGAADRHELGRQT